VSTLASQKRWLHGVYCPKRNEKIRRDEFLKKSLDGSLRREPALNETPAKTLKQNAG
jgi:hypothetical protein